MTDRENDLWHDWIIENMDEMQMLVEPLAFRDCGNGELEQLFRVQFILPEIGIHGQIVSIKIGIDDLDDIIHPGISAAELPDIDWENTLPWM